MELRQLRYLVRVIELGSLERAAVDLQLPPAALAGELEQLERVLSISRLRRTSDGVLPTEAGLSFFGEAQLALRHADRAAHAAQSRLTGAVSVGLTPTACSVLGLPLILEARKRYPEVRLHLVESLSGHLAAMLNARQLDLAVLYGAHAGRRWHMRPLLEERLFLIQSARLPTIAITESPVSFADLKQVPFVLPTGTHSLRNLVDAAFTRARIAPTIVAEIDSLTMLMDAVDAGVGATLQPWTSTRRFSDAAQRFQVVEVADAGLVRASSLCSVSNDELSPAAAGVRVLLSVCARELVRSGAWVGARLTGG